MTARLPPLTKRCRDLMREFWELRSQSGRYTTVLDKYQMALVFAHKPKLDTGLNPYQDAALLVMLRNKLVHFLPK